MASSQLTFDKLVYIDRLKSVGIDDAHARAHAEALDLAFRDTVATKGDVRDEISRLEQKIEISRAEKFQRGGLVHGEQPFPQGFEPQGQRFSRW